MEEFALEGQESKKPWRVKCEAWRGRSKGETGGAAKIAISEGLVKVDDAVELRKRCKIRSGQVVEFNGSKVVVR